MSCQIARPSLTLWGLFLGALSLPLLSGPLARAGVVATTRYVSNGGNNSNPGTDRDSPKLTIQNAIDASVSGDTVIVLDGTYTGAGNKDLDYSNGLMMGTRTITVKSENGPAVTTIDCQGSGRGFLFDSGETSAAQVEGFTIRNGLATGSGGGEGGGMLISGSSPTVKNCIFSSNTAAAGTLEGGRGGGMNVQNGSPAVTNCTFTGNTALDGANGGAGAGMYLINSSAVVANCTFNGNTTSGPSGDGGRGGGMNIQAGSPAVVNCTFSGNTAGSGFIFGGRGGGMLVQSDGAMVINCTFSGNSVLATGTLGGRGGGLEINGSSTVSNSIVWGNTPDQIGSFFFTPPTVTYNDVQGGFPGMGNINADPKFVRTPFTNGPTDFGDLHLQAGSPCIDAGNNAPVTAPPFPADGGGTVLDKDGNPRFVNDPATMDTGAGTAPIVDMGAFEFAPPPSPPRPIALTLTNTSVTGGGLVGGRVTLDKPAPMGGLLLTFTSTPGGASVAGGTVTVPAGQTTFPASPNWFTIQTTSQSSNTTLQLKVEANGGEATANLLVKAPYVWRLRFTPNPTNRNRPTVLFGELTGPLPPGGAMIPLTSTNQAVFANRTVNVLAGAQNFTVNFTPTNAGSATVTATYPAGKTASAPLVVNP
jgi:parallel beta helix pectate lyase-like protein